MQSADDVVIVSAVRTAVTRAKKGGFKDTHPEDLLAAALKVLFDSFLMGVVVVVVEYTGYGGR